MEIYKDSFVGLDEFDFENYIPYFKNLIERTRSKYETLMDSLSDKIQHLSKHKRVKFTKFMVNIIAHLSVLLRIVEKEIENMNILEDDLYSDIEINYIRNSRCKVPFVGHP